MINTIAGSGEVISDGRLATAAELSGPMASVTGDGSVYVADYGNNWVRRVSTDGIISTVAGISSRR